MRRKSERNKAKGSPEKKVEKPTRKSTRRRAGRKSPSTSPEPEITSKKTENVAQVEKNVEKEVAVSEARVESSETKKDHVEEVNEEKVSSSGKDKVERDEEDEEDAGSVWKVARADASPGEIQKLKLCRQRNTSEASSDSRRKESNDKWQESGEGVAGEVDSAEEQLVSCRRMPSGEEPNDPSSSSYPGQESSQEEVSDSKDFLPETTSANLLSDDKPNIDRQGDPSQADEKHVSEPASSNGELEAKDSGSQETQEESLPKPKEEDGAFRKESSAENEEEKPSTSTDDEEDKKIIRSRRRSSSESNEDREKTKIPSNPKTPSRASRRKHRNKYGDSSNSESPDSEDESRNVEQKVEETHVPEEKKEEEKREDKPKERRSEENMEITVESEENDDRKSSQVSSGIVEEVKPTPAQKPAKVNLKRSFTARTFMDKNEVKKDDTTVNNESASQNKENHADVDQDSKFVSKRRRWGTALSTTDTAPAFSISTESLMALVPGAKPLPINEVRLSKDDDEEREGHRSQEKRRDSSDSAGEEKLDEQKNGPVKKEGKMDNNIAARRKISIVKEIPDTKSPSPPASKPTNVLLIKNLVRPFTLNQIKELLSRTGTIVENGFWMDRIKSKCFVEYSNEDQAFETRQALHGISWPLSNPKRLHVEYATKEEMEQVRESSKEQTLPRKLEAVSTTMTTTTETWQQDWSQERTNATKVTVVREWDLGKEDGQALLKDKEKKGHEKKRRQRSRSPGIEAHLPAPARKFKKKEDEPPPAKLLDDLFRKTKATPCIYWLPLTNEQIVVKEEMRRQHMAEHARRMEEMRRAERNRDGRRRRSPRK